MVKNGIRPLVLRNIRMPMTISNMQPSISVEKCTSVDKYVKKDNYRVPLCDD